MKNSTVAIVGSHPRTKDLAPFADTGIDIWVFNEVVGKNQVPRADGVFQMHRPAIWKNPGNRNDPHHYEWLQQEHEIPVFMLNDYDEIPSCYPFPLESLCDDLLSNFTRSDGQQIRYFTSSVSYAIALAIHHGYRKLMLYGVEMETDTEYAYQRDGVYFWLGVAVGKGIEVVICDQSGLFRSPLYGYEGDIELNPAEFGKRLQVLEPMLPDKQKAMEATRKEQDAALQKATGDPEHKQEHIKTFFAAIKKQAQAVIDYGAIQGATEENRRYKSKAETMLTGPAGEILFSRQEFEQSAAKAQELQRQYESLMHTNGAAATQAWNELQDMTKASQRARNRQTSAYLDCHLKYMKAALEFGRFSGIVQENIRFMGIVDELVRMAGGAKSEEAMIQARQLEAVNA